MPASAIRLLVAVLLALPLSACVETPTAPGLSPGTTRFALTDPPPPPIAGREPHSGGGSEDVSCGQGWTSAYFRQDLTFEYMAAPTDRMARLVIHGEAVTSTSAWIATSGTYTHGSGMLHLAYGWTFLDIDLSKDTYGSVVRPAGANEFWVALWGQLTLPGGQTCRVLGTIGIELEKPIAVSFYQMQFKSHPAALSLSSPSWILYGAGVRNDTGAAVGSLQDALVYLRTSVVQGSNRVPVSLTLFDECSGNGEPGVLEPGSCYWIGGEVFQPDPSGVESLAPGPAQVVLELELISTAGFPWQRVLDTHSFRVQITE